MALGLLEAVFSATLTASVLAMLAMGTLMSGRLLDQLARAISEPALELQLERLFDRTVANPATLGAPRIVVAEPRRFLIDTDLDGNGRINERSAESSGFELVERASALELRHRMGRQSMTIVRGLAPQASFVYRDRYGEEAATTQTVRSVALERPDVDAPLQVRVWTIPE